MRRCTTCGRSMAQVWSFGPEKNEKFFRCGYCHSETRHKAITANDLNFHESEDLSSDRRNYKVGVGKPDTMAGRVDNGVLRQQCEKIKANWNAKMVKPRRSGK